MPRKGKRRRDEQRARRARPGEPQKTEAPTSAAPPAERPRPREQRRPAAHRPAGGGLLISAARLWTVGTLAVTAGILLAGGIVVLIVFLVISGGSNDSTASNPTKSAPALLGGKPPEVTLTVDATDQGQAINPQFSPNTPTAKAGQVVKIVMVNKGSVHHNLHVAGADNLYDTADDWLTTPESIEAGAEGSLLLKIDKAGAYPFKCDFHPDQQTGTLTITP